MDVKAIGEFISTIGFPIVACLLMGKYFSKRDEKYQNDLEKMRDIVDNNTKALNELNTAYNNTNLILREMLSTIQKLKVGERKNE